MHGPVAGEAHPAPGDGGKGVKPDCNVTGLCAHCASGCPACGNAKRETLGCNPNRENGPWIRCFECGALWDRDGRDLLPTHPDIVMSSEQLADWRAGKR